MDIVIDIQGYKGFTGRFIAKEIALVGVNSDIVGHWVLKSSKSLKFPTKYEMEYNWIITHCHRLKWNEGHADFRKLMKYIRKIMSESDRVYVRGKCKSDFIKGYTRKLSHIINLEEEEDCPNFNQLDASPNICSYHSNMGNSTKRSYCALTQAYQLRDWIKRNSSVEAWFNNM